MKLKLSILFLVFTLLVGSAFVPGNRYFEISKHIEIFANLYKEINTYYVDDLDPGSVMRTGIDAMLEALDPYTNYISEAQIEDYRYATEGKYHGIGAFIKIIDGRPTIVNPYETSPVSKAGLKAGDRILEVDHNSTADKSSDEVNSILQGYPGTEVDLLVERPGQAQPISATLVREEVNVENVPYYAMVKDGIGYISLTTFTRNAGRNISNALTSLKDENPDMKGVMLDLRGNGGGLLNEAVSICNIFIPKNEIVVNTKGKVKEWDRAYTTNREAVDLEIPLAILINKNSASASEIVSGVIQDYDRGILVGQRSYGKGLVQNTKDIGYNSKVKITTAKYYIPSGRCIQSVEYKEGEPVDIDESKRAAFKTRAGRRVLDGGGVKPDVFIDKKDNITVIKNLKEKHHIFNYATDYVTKNPTIADASTFKLTDYNAFVSYVKSKNFSNNTETEKALSALKEKVKQEDYHSDLLSQITSLEDQLNVVKEKDLTKYQNEIAKLIEQEIVSRYYFEKGKIQHSLVNDEEVIKAMQLLNDKVQYNKILGR